MEQDFSQQIAKLNPAQKQAVETIYGPVLLLAGPGSGKTHVIALRIANKKQIPILIIFWRLLLQIMQPRICVADCLS